MIQPVKSRDVPFLQRCCVFPDHLVNSPWSLSLLHEFVVCALLPQFVVSMPAPGIRIRRTRPIQESMNEGTTRSGTCRLPGDLDMPRVVQSLIPFDSVVAIPVGTVAEPITQPQLLGNVLDVPG